jgi:hypothetical protein
MTGDWVLLAYRIPREPSTPRIAVWRKLRQLGALQLLDGLVALPADARTREHLEWIAEQVTAAGGEADIWLARPATKAQQRALVAQMSDDTDAAYDTIVDEAAAAMSDPPVARKRTLARLRRELKRVRQRDHFPTDGFDRATSALDRLESNLTTDSQPAQP